jgi:hypothetical protein
MQTATRRRTGWAITASAIAHLAVGIVVLLQRPMLVAPELEHGPPEPIIPILIMPKTPPAAPGAHLAQAAPIRLHRRPQPFLPPDVPTAPIAPPAPAAPAAAAPAPAPGPAVLHPAPMPEGPKGDVRTALRRSYVGCANADAVALTRAERDLCDEKFGKGAKDTAFAGLGLTADKQRLLDAAAARKEEDYRYKRGTVPSGLGKGDKPGVTAHEMGEELGNPKPELKIPF